MAAEVPCAGFPVVAQDQVLVPTEGVRPERDR
jgi:hypothetical protein